MQKADVLSFYKKKEIEQAIVEAGSSREVAVKFSDKGFGKRPDTLMYPSEVLDLAKSGATSFHASEERWSNPLHIQTGMRKAQIDKLRIGWDLIIDIDAPVWSISKLTAWLVVEALEEFGLKSISVKFSGNKGFHIGVPFECFPKEINGMPTRELFPQAPRAIASLILAHISEHFIRVENDEIKFGVGRERVFKVSFNKLKETIGKSRSDLVIKKCTQCKTIIKEQDSLQAEFLCPKCEWRSVGSEEYRSCEKCGSIMKRIETKVKKCKCDTEEFISEFFDPLKIIEVDTILISSRHLFRMPYSLHEKSGLVSLPFNAKKVLLFEKKFAHPNIVKPSKHVFLDARNAQSSEAEALLQKALDNIPKEEEKTAQYEEYTGEAIPEQCFPPAIKRMLEGLEDGKKRALFVLTNFLQSVGWSLDDIEKRLREWNEKNPEPLKETLVVGQIRYKKQTKEKILPPNYDKDYYQGIGISPTQEEMRFKNPVNAAKILAKRLKAK